MIISIHVENTFEYSNTPVHDKKDKEQGKDTSPATLLNITLEVLAKAIRKENETKDILMEIKK